MQSLVWLRNSFKAYLKDEEGQTSLEYILLVAVVVAIIFKFKAAFSAQMEKIINEVFSDSKIQDLMK